MSWEYIDFKQAITQVNMQIILAEIEIVYEISFPHTLL